MRVRLLGRSAINDQAWNTFVGQSPQQIIYAYTWYLDVVSPRWVALIIEDENRQWIAAMPVPLRRKFGVWVVCQPLFCQLLGIYCRAGCDNSLTNSALLTTLPHFFCYASIYTGIFGKQTAWPDFFQTQHCENYILPLQQPYQAIHEGYTADRRINLKRAQNFGWQSQESTDIEPLIGLFAQHHAPRIAGGVSEKSYQLLRRLFEVLAQKKMVQLRYALKDNQIEAGILLVLDTKRIIYLFNAASELGRQKNARTYLIDSTLQHYANEDLYFDFESPPIDSIAAFYHSFGSIAEPYTQFRYNQLPFWMQKLRAWRLSLLPSTTPA
ncbi:MAG: GNAT family N-acetyltransferase [Cytophagia bacterium]|nr:MAG: GNAT family N-acetyltransferase [Runella sp.]TAG24014.1 MAG: GNAT family N-acetyltransferase [Cytophagales bacterium]TAG34663.1 MAG: GNAT family N-acetyltransferase [Cytophagia bacterium]TAG53322.1 MAG: GNAT family N-acetyltransferase [Runella slithyformis]TAG76767.1 MAG: GNAT family N-acetyltransferase [Cytophagales bacterium]